MKKNIIGICAILLVILVLAGCVYKKSAQKENQKRIEDAIEDMRREEMYLYGEFSSMEIIMNLDGTESDGLDYVDFSTYIEKMEEYDSLLKYSNLYEWMISEDIEMKPCDYDIITKKISDKDYSNVISTFYSLDDEVKSKVLRHMFADTGLYETRTVATKYDYVPTGSKTENGDALMEYRATEKMNLSTKIYTIFPLKLEEK